MATKACTCCEVHGQGVHRPALVAPAAEESLELKRADKALAQAAEAELRAREEWGEAAVSAKQFEAGLFGKYRSTMQGIEMATGRERGELKRLQEAAGVAFEVFQAKARETVEKRQLQAAETHRDLQARIGAWGVGA